MVKVEMIRISIGTVAETENDSSSGKTDFEPDDIKVRFKIHEPYNRSVDVIISTNSSFRAETRDKVIVGDLERVGGSIT